MTGAAALTEALRLEGCTVVFGIPGAQENELWDTLKARHCRYLLVTHEFSAAAVADGYARSTGKPGVLCVVPGPGVTNALTGLGEALLDSVPLVCIVGDVARGDKYRAVPGPRAAHRSACCSTSARRSLTSAASARIPLRVRQAFRAGACAASRDRSPSSSRTTC